MSAESEIQPDSVKMHLEQNKGNYKDNYNFQQEQITEDQPQTEELQDSEQISSEIPVQSTNEQQDEQKEDNENNEQQVDVQTPQNNNQVLKNQKRKNKPFKSRITEDMLPKPPAPPPKKPKYVPDRSIDEKFRRARREAAALEQRREEQKRLLSEHQKRLQLNDQREEEERENQKLSELLRRRQQMLAAVQQRRDARVELQAKIKEAAEAQDVLDMNQLIKDVVEERRRCDPGLVRRQELEKRAEWMKKIDQRILYGIFAPPEVTDGQQVEQTSNATKLPRKQGQNDQSKAQSAPTKQPSQKTPQKSKETALKTENNPKTPKKTVDSLDKVPNKLPQLKNAVKQKIK